MKHDYQAMYWLEKDVLGTLADIRLAAGEPRIGTREVELVRGDGRIWWVLKKLRAEGKITRACRYCWITEPAFEEWQLNRQQLEKTKT